MSTVVTESGVGGADRAAGEIAAPGLLLEKFLEWWALYASAASVKTYRSARTLCGFRRNSSASSVTVSRAGKAPFIEKPTEDNVREREIPRERFPAILAAIECPDTRALCEWLLLTATRPKGARDLRWEWFDREKWTLKVPGEKRRSRRERFPTTS